MDNVNLELLMIIVGVFTLGFWLGRKVVKSEKRAIGFDSPSPNVRSGSSHAPSPTWRVTDNPRGAEFALSRDAFNHVKNAIDRNRKIEAIKIFREATGAGLKESKEAVEMMIRNPGTFTPSDHMTTKTADVDFELTGEALDQINHAIDGNRKIEAIKIFREVTGAGLKDAKDAVEMMERHRLGRH